MCGGPNAFTLSFGAPAAPLPLDGPPFAADGSEGVLLNAFTLFLGTLAVGALTFGMLLGTLTFGTLAVGTLTFGMLVGTLTLWTLAVGTLTFGMLVGTLTLGVGTLTLGTLAVGTLTFGMLVGTLTLGTLTVGTFAPPALARSAPTTTAQRATETLTSFVALILSLPGLAVAELVKCYKCYVLLGLIYRRGFHRVATLFAGWIGIASTRSLAAMRGGCIVSR